MIGDLWVLVGCLEGAFWVLGSCMVGAWWVLGRCLDKCYKIFPDMLRFTVESLPVLIYWLGF